MFTSAISMILERLLFNQSNRPENCLQLQEEIIYIRIGDCSLQLFCHGGK